MIWVQQPERFPSKQVMDKQAHIEHQHNQDDELDHSAYANYFEGDLYNQYNSQENAQQASVDTQLQAAEPFTQACVPTYPPVCVSGGEQ